MNYPDHPRVPQFAPALALCLLMTVPLVAQQLPALNWEPRSDWINIKADISPKAVGDGIADDTRAIQAALNEVSEQTGRPATVYLPPGTYRITRTLELKQKDGVAVMGCGRLTRILWDGPGGKGDDARMFWSNGSPRSRYIGLTWDGQGKAHVGFDHDSKGYFETEIDHRHEAFLNFTGSGIRIGHDQNTPGAQATAETTYANCLFVNCENGFTLMQFNDYNHTVTGCEFRGCGVAVNSVGGANFYVRDTHFENSRGTDIRARGEHGISVRRCTSTGSHMFLEEATIAPLTVQDCQVSAWTNPTGAITLGSGPVLLFDCVFANPPGRHPPITVSGGQSLVYSTTKSAGTDGLVEPGSSPNITEIPPGKLGGSLKSPAQAFFRDTARIPGKVFDARGDFGAKGDGRTDDYAAAQATINAARAHGKGAIAYFPSGTYPVSSPITMTGGDYYLGGCGVHTQLRGRTSPGQPVVQIEDPRDIILDNIAVYGDGGENSSDIVQTGSGVSRIHYERVWVSGMYTKKPFVGGLHVRSLAQGAVITGLHVNGNLRFTESSRATILISTSFEGSILVEGKEAVRDGMLGFMTRLGTIVLQGLYVRDSQSIVMSDFYMEQSDRLLDFQGNAGDPAGRVTLQMPKSHCTQNPVIRIQDYRGGIALASAMFYPGGVTPAHITQQGTNLCDFLLLACQAYQVTPQLDLSGSAQGTLLGNTGQGMGKNELPGGALGKVAEALDDLRRLGVLDLILNYP